MNKFLKIIVLIVSMCGIIYFSYNIISYILDESANNDLNNELQNIAIKTVDLEHEPQNNNEEQNNKTSIEIDFDVLKQKNSDIVGWIYLENSPINFPVVQSKDNEYYLRRLLDGTYNRAGTIFMDYRNNKDLTDWITILYGHNMKDNTMFGSLINFKNQEYYDEHRKLYYFTDSKNFEINLIAGYTENSDSKIYDIPINEKTKDAIIKNAVNKSTFKSNIDIMSEDKVIALSTCSYEYDEARYILLGIIR